MRSTLLSCILAAGFWFFLFSPWTSQMVNFWGVMAGAVGILAIIGLVSNRSRLKELYAFHPRWLTIGLVSAAILYLIFFVGDKISTMLFNFADPQVAGIYGIKSHASPELIAGLLLLWVGPAEEIFWRGFVQQRCTEKFGKWKGYFITASIYAGIHIWALNFMLFMASLVCGLFWGWMFLKYQSVWPGLISHAIWDVTIFVILPIR